MGMMDEEGDEWLAHLAADNAPESFRLAVLAMFVFGEVSESERIKDAVGQEARQRYGPTPPEDRELAQVAMSYVLRDALYAAADLLDARISKEGGQLSLEDVQETMERRVNPE